MNRERDEARTEAEEEKKEDCRTWASFSYLKLIVSTNLHNSHVRKNQRPLTAIAQLSDAFVTHQSSHSSTSQADVTQAIDTSNAFCKLFVVITWLSTSMFCLISYFPLFLLISLILVRIHPFPVSLGSHERREVIKKKKRNEMNEQKGRGKRIIRNDP